MTNELMYAIMIIGGYTMNNKIIANKARCKKCNDIIESKNIHDFKKCLCGSVAVDGGHEYIKRIGKLEDVIELSEYEEVKEETNESRQDAHS